MVRSGVVALLFTASPDWVSVCLFAAAIVAGVAVIACLAQRALTEALIALSVGLVALALCLAT